jgi:GT2 family glycosyltransferase
MRVLAHIHTLNEAAVIDRAIAALERQARPPDAIIIVDNGSTDGTLDRKFPERVTVIRNPTNVGVSGSIRNGISYALEHGFDWIWILDADSAAEPDALKTLLALYEGWPLEQRDETAFLACLHYNADDGIPRHGSVFSRYRLRPVTPTPDERYYPCHVTIWSGCLYRLAALRRVGLPNPDYVMDWGEGEYGYRVMKAGYKGFICQNALLRHNLRGTSVTSIERKLGPITLRLREFAPVRCYYVCRNLIYFALYDAAAGRVRLLCGAVRWVIPLTLNFLLRPRHHGPQIRACLRGLWDGVTGNIQARY